MFRLSLRGKQGGGRGSSGGEAKKVLSYQKEKRLLLLCLFAGDCYAGKQIQLKGPPTPEEVHEKTLKSLNNKW